ncbi:MAG: hypothetical protein HY600_06175, partial [Candidatus Omnitrophica bacterium]|nr:hypothetical protein [Candidatus Omnitrophota bacterium]
VHLVEPLVYLVEPLVYLREPLVHLVEAAVHLVEPLVYLVEPLVYLREPLVHLVEAAVHLVEPLVYLREPLVDLLKAAVNIAEPRDDGRFQQINALCQPLLETIHLGLEQTVAFGDGALAGEDFFQQHFEPGSFTGLTGHLANSLWVARGMS